MDPAKRTEMAELIKKEIEKTEENINAYKEDVQPIAPENAIGRISRMDAINNKSVVEAALKKAEEKLKALKFLVQKVNDDEFGLCARCNNPIPYQRMLFLPQSPFCVNCAS
ncbi:MAG TPA: TraR/DksA family transcriptional regulator [Flavobacteriales bacterium]|nr:TraR/DksA family transcriptional regulator [Flavobacteriales bacterium]